MFFISINNAKKYQHFCCHGAIIIIHLILNLFQWWYINSTRKKNHFKNKKNLGGLFLFSSSQSGTCVKFEKYNVTIFNSVISPILTIFSGSFCRSLRPVFFEIVVIHTFGHDETLFKIGMNSSSGLRCLGSFL